MLLQLLIDRMIDQAIQIDPTGSYNILIGSAPVTETDWATGKREYRQCPVVQTRLVPNYSVVLAPSPENLRARNLIEYHGRILNGDVTRYTIRQSTLFSSDHRLGS